MPRLVLPATKYRKSFLEDFFDNVEMKEMYALTGVPKNQVAKRFPEFIRKLKLQSKGVFSSPRTDLIPQTVYWLVDGKKFLGKTDIRHSLNKHLRHVGGHIGYYIRPGERGKGYGKLILKLALKKAKRLGIKSVLITCDLTNLKSKKIIEGNGGRFASRVKMGKNLPDKLRYWIKI